MLASSFKRTKIIATLGPASSSARRIEAIISAGANGLRLNFSHGSHAEHAERIKLAREASARLNRPVAIIQDLQGPKIRVGALPENGITFIKDTEVKFEFGADFEAGSIIPLQYDISPYVREGQKMFLRDGQIAVRIESVKGKTVTTKVVAPGTLLANQGINLPDTSLDGDILTVKDIADIAFGVKNDVDYIALSFVQSAGDIVNLKKRLKALKSDVAVIAKIETKAAAQSLEEIIKASDGVMVARGDLAIETQTEAVPILQKSIIRMARKHKKIVIVATQMLESMITSPQPTRAEVSDVAGAVFDGTDAVMLSGETAMGQYPVETVRLMKRVIKYTEDTYLKTIGVTDFGDAAMGNAISAAAITLAKQMPAKIIIAETTSGQTAKNLASYRPSVPVIMATHVQRVYQQLALVWGGKSYLLSKPQGASDRVIKRLLESGNLVPGDAVVIASGHHSGVVGGTDTVQVRVV